MGFDNRKLWFPCRFFTINAASITLIAIAMKLPVDLNINVGGDSGYFIDPKTSSIYFLITMLANFLPSLGLMDDKELVLNIIALGILLITIVVNVCVQIFTKNPYMFQEQIFFFLIFSVSWPLSVALTVSSSRRILEHGYKELHKLALKSHEELIFSYKELVHRVKRSWMITETGNPQFVIACSPISSTSGVICAMFVVASIYNIVRLLVRFDEYPILNSHSDYKWSLKVITIVQSIGVVVGSIAPIFRCLTAISNFNISKKWSMNYLNMFRVERYWIQRLQQWKRSHVRSYIQGRHCQMIFNVIKNMILNVFVALQVMVVVICKTISLGPRIFLLLISCCLYLCNSLLKPFKKKPSESNDNLRLELEEYTCYVLQVEKEAKLSKRLLRNTLNSINRLLQKFEEKEPMDLMKLLEKSAGFKGIVEFDDYHVPLLHDEETKNCWSLVMVTLTAITLALPNIAHDHVKELVAGMKEGLRYIRHIEELLNSDDELVNTRKAARRVWTGVEVYGKWLEIDVRKKAHEGKTSKEVLEWLGDESIKIVIEFKRCKKGSLNHSFYKFIAASCMYRISQTILLRCNKQENQVEGKEVFEWVSTIIADILFACFTNLPRVIAMKCHHETIEKRKESIMTAAQLLGTSKKILNILEGRQLPNLDVGSMAYIDNWRALLESQTSSVCSSPSCNESVVISIVQ